MPLDIGVIKLWDQNFAFPIHLDISEIAKFSCPEMGEIDEYMTTLGFDPEKIIKEIRLTAKKINFEKDFQMHIDILDEIVESIREIKDNSDFSPIS